MKKSNPNRVKIGDHEVVLKERHSWSDMACALPAVLLLAVLTYYPLCKLVQISFTNWNLLKPTWEYVGFKNWNWLFTSTVGKPSRNTALAAHRQSRLLSGDTSTRMPK